MRIDLPLNDQVIRSLKAGDKVELYGTIYTARDIAHSRLVDLVKKDMELPIDIKGSVIFYVGPTPAKPGHVIGSAGPTTSYRMDSFTPILLEKGLRGMIGKGPRSKEVKNSIVKNKAIYFAAVGGAGALIAKSIKKSTLIAYEDLGPEAIRKLEVEGFPAIVVNDIYKNDLYQQGRLRYQLK
ncbi:fumarate hydratase [Clostridium novyi A str. 4570]|uniref:Fumarate hydratase n=1 Tax=Clostridium novyi A str. 4570 TaxID=1444290 RepID=A0AA88ZKM5_CLONO|nr:Fe-S-containing hydro-lyase [Clostridium novyi]KGN00897.1 fumarate hydratase [Clostridium novyi A str. 4570]